MSAATATAQTLPSQFVPAPLHMGSRAVPRIAVIDDDPMFGRVMEQVGRKVGVEIKHFESFETLDGFDVVIVDYRLETMTGLDVGRHVERFIGSLPVILVSRTNLPKSRDWPRCIKEFVPKSLGAYAILDAAIEAHGLSTVEKTIKKIGRAIDAKIRPH